MPTAEVTVSAPISAKRPPGTNWDAVPLAKYPVQSLSGTLSWGTEPGQFNLVYLSSNAVTVGSAVRVKLGQYYFAGVCEADVPLTSSRGHNRQLTFRDYRKWLAWDKAYCSFNHIEDKIFNGVRSRRYWHILPNNFFNYQKTWTSAPYAAAQIVQFVLTGPGIETPWTVGYLNGSGVLQQGLYHANMALPVLSLDCLSGRPLSVLLSDICEQTGLLFTLASTSSLPFNLVFAQKGVDGSDVTFPDESDNRESGTELSGNPTRIRVLGDRNLYQVHDIWLEPDWNTNYNQFYDINLWVEYVFQHFITWNSTTDPEQIIARQQALSKALEMTLWEFDNLLGAVGNLLDSRKYSGRARNDMPVALYIQNILFRCFRLPTGFWFRNTYGNRIYTDSMEIQDKLLAKVSHDPITGATSYDINANVDGNAYVIVKGYQVGKDMFESIRPERFNLSEWTSAQAIWQKIEARIEDPGDTEGMLIVFDEPVIKSEDLVTLVNGYAVFQAAPTITVPQVKATLTFAAERFSWFQTGIEDPGAPPSDPVMGTQVNDDVLNVGGLNGEFIAYPGSALYESYYADAKSVRYKAIEYANNVLKSQWLHARGKFSLPIVDDFAYTLTGKIDRISLDHSANGSVVTVDLTNERTRPNFIQERDLDRSRKLNTLFPGQAELKKQADAAKKIAAAVKSSKDAYALLSEAFHGNFTASEYAKPVTVQPTTAGTVPVGSVFLKESNTLTAGRITKTQPLLQQDAPNERHEFSGVTVRHNEPINATTGATLRVQNLGPSLARVKGPVNAGDSLSTAPLLLDSHLIKTGSADSSDGSISVGVAAQTITDSSIALIRVMLGVGGGDNGEVFPVWV